MIRPRTSFDITESFLRRLAGQMTAEEARRHLLAAEAQCQNGCEKDGWLELAKLVVRELPEMSLRLAVDLLQADPRVGHELGPSSVTSGVRDRYLSPREVREFLHVAVGVLVKMCRDDVRDANEQKEAMGGLLITIWAHERMVDELPQELLDRLVQAALTTEVIDEFSRARVQWTSYAALSVRAAENLSDETYLQVYLGNHSYLEEADFIGGITPDLVERPGVWGEETVRSDLAFYSCEYDLAKVFGVATDDVFADLLRRVLDDEPEKAARAVWRAEQQPRAGRYSEADDWLPALSASDPEAREAARAILGYVSAGASRSRGCSR